MLPIALLCLACGNDKVPVNAVPAPTSVSPTPLPPTPIPTMTQPKNGNYSGKGLVTKVDSKTGSVELNHEEIVGLMPAMIMEFYVKDKAMLNGLAVGDKVDFVIEYKNGTEVIVGLKKIK